MKLKIMSDAASGKGVSEGVSLAIAESGSLSQNGLLGMIAGRRNADDRVVQLS